MSKDLKELSKQVESLAKQVADTDKNNIPTLCEVYKTLHDFATELSAINDTVQQLKQYMSYEVLPNAFENVFVDSVKIKGYNFVIGARTNASIPLEAREDAHKWLRDNGLGNIVLPTVNAKTLSASMKEYILEHGKAPPRELIKIHMQKYTSVRKA